MKTLTDRQTGRRDKCMRQTGWRFDYDSCGQFSGVQCTAFLLWCQLTRAQLQMGREVSGKSPIISIYPLDMRGPPGEPKCIELLKSVVSSWPVNIYHPHIIIIQDQSSRTPSPVQCTSCETVETVLEIIAGSAEIEIVRGSELAETTTRVCVCVLMVVEGFV